MRALHGQLMPTLQATRLQDFTSIRRLHPLAETVYTHTTADTRLPSTLNHSFFPSFTNSKPHKGGNIAVGISPNYK